MRRRRFLRTLGAALAIAGIAVGPAALILGKKETPFSLGIPKLWGDGVHDDSPALQALIDGKSVEYRGRVIGGPKQVVHLPPGNYFITKPLIA